MPEAIPPGRAGRLWLVGRVASTRRSLELLDRKRQLLLVELTAMGERRARAAERWRAASAEAERWGARANAVGGAAEVGRATASVAGRAQVDVPWRNTMGVVHPGPPACDLPHLDPIEVAAVTAAVGPAAAAAQDAPRPPPSTGRPSWPTGSWPRSLPRPGGATGHSSGGGCRPWRRP